MVHIVVQKTILSIARRLEPLSVEDPNGIFNIIYYLNLAPIDIHQSKFYSYNDLKVILCKFWSIHRIYDYDLFLSMYYLYYSNVHNTYKI